MILTLVVLQIIQQQRYNNVLEVDEDEYGRYNAAGAEHHPRTGWRKADVCFRSSGLRLKLQKASEQFSRVNLKRKISRVGKIPLRPVIPSGQSRKIPLYALNAADHSACSPSVICARTALMPEPTRKNTDSRRIRLWPANRLSAYAERK